MIKKSGLFSVFLGYVSSLRIGPSPGNKISNCTEFDEDLDFDLILTSVWIRLLQQIPKNNSTLEIVKKKTFQEANLLGIFKDLVKSSREKKLKGSLCARAISILC